MTDTRKEFQEWFKSKYSSPDFVARYDEYFKLNVYGEFVDWVEDRFNVWQACQSLNDKRIQQLLAVIEVQRDALKFYANAESHDDQVCCGLANWSGNPNESPECCGLPVNSIALDNGKLASEALAIKPENVELVEVGSVGRDGNGHDVVMWTDFVAKQDTKLYTIKTKEPT